MRGDVFDKDGNRRDSERGLRIGTCLEVKQIGFLDRMWDLSQSEKSITIFRF